MVVKAIDSIKSKGGFHQQVAALPVRQTGGEAEILLITSRTTRRWIIPKGWPMRGKTLWAAAACEAFEEAGVEGSIERKPCGWFEYEKADPKGERSAFRVAVFILSVERQARKWPEASQRKLLWLPAEAAAAKVSDRSLADVIRELDLTSLANPVG